MTIRFAKIFTTAEDGAMTAYGLVIGMAMLGIGGLAVDVASAYKARTQLQVTADAVAHAALYYREFETEADSKDAAAALAEVNLPYSRYGNTITADDIQFGIWDVATQTFQIDPNSKTSVMVDIARVEERNNGIGTYFLGFAGFDNWDVRRAAVFETYQPTCFEEGIVGHEPVNIQSNNSFVNGFCVHSNDFVELNNGVYFEDDTVLSMPDRQDLVEPTSGNNIGVTEALRDGVYQMRIISRLPDVIQALNDLDPDWLPDYITSSSVLSLPRNAQPSDFIAGSVHYMALLRFVE